MMQRKWTTAIVVVLAVSASYLLGRVNADPPAKAEEHERKIKESDVPKAALAALKKQAGANTITKFEEEVEHGQKYYEGSWKGPNGTVEVLVTEAGDLYEIEEAVPVDSLPKAVLDAARKEAGKDATLRAEKKTSTAYEVKFTTGKTRHEVVFTPDGRVAEHEKEEGGAEED